jgi:hypothetical protein
MYGVELVDAPWPAFQSLTLEPGADRQERFFVLVPKDAPARALRPPLVHG